MWRRQTICEGYEDVDGGLTTTVKWGVTMWGDACQGVTMFSISDARLTSFEVYREGDWKGGDMTSQR